MNLAVVGSREYPNLPQVEEFVRLWLGKHPNTRLVSGGARGVDLTAEGAGIMAGADVLSFRPKKYHRPAEYVIEVVYHLDGSIGLIGEVFGRYSSYGQAAFARNAMIVAKADLVVAFPHGGAKGTRHSIDLAEKQMKPLVVTTPAVDPIALVYEAETVIGTSLFASRLLG